MRAISDICLSPAATVRDALETLDAKRAGIVLIVDDDGRLIGTVTDGDVRRSIIAQRPLDTPVTQVMCRRPVVAAATDSLDRLRSLMDVHRIRQVPILDGDGRPKRLCDVQDLVHQESTFAFAVILAGGEGRRLLPLTENVPKPMLKVGDIPILENLIGSLVASGIRRLYLSVNYKAEVIEECFGDGSRLNAQIEYLREPRKLGTAGPLRLIPDLPSGPFLVVNGDIVTSYDFSHLYDYHWRHRCVVTVGAAEYKIQVPYGALKLAGHYVLGVDEKPVVRIACSAGIYALNPEILSYIPDDRPFDMTDLLDELIRSGLPVAAFAIHERWLDVGQLQDLIKAQEEHQRRSPLGDPAALGEQSRS